MADTPLTGTRIALGHEYEGDFECSACGVGLRGNRVVVAVPRRTSSNIVRYSLVHDRPTCIRVVT